VPGLDGSHAVLIPERNRRHLMLDRDVVDAVSRGLFQVHAVAHVLDGIELLTGNPAGDFEVADSVLARAGQTLRDYRQACRRFGRRAGR
jgi:predicted ATP-dependent protease